jgi:hypothetical protein
VTAVPPPFPSAPEFETSVLDEFRGRLLEFCSSRRTGPVGDFARIEVAITVVTAWEVPSLRDVLRRYATRILGTELTGARLTQVLFAVDERLAEPWLQVAVQGRLRDDGLPPTGPDETAQPVVVLTLAYEGHHQYVFLLASSSAWLPIRRGPAAEDDRQEIPLPDHLYVVPSGALLDLRYWQGRVAVRRTPARPEYAVLVDRHELAVGRQVELMPRGAIAYAGGDRQSVLAYLLSTREW